MDCGCPSLRPPAGHSQSPAQRGNKGVRGLDVSGKGFTCHLGTSTYRVRMADVVVVVV